jgi:hypothetical protein
MNSKQAEHFEWAGLDDAESRTAVTLLRELLIVIDRIGVNELREDGDGIADSDGDATWPDLAITFDDVHTFLRATNYAPELDNDTEPSEDEEDDDA